MSFIVYICPDHNMALPWGDTGLVGFPLQQTHGKRVLPGASNTALSLTLELTPEIYEFARDKYHRGEMDSVNNLAHIVIASEENPACRQHLFFTAKALEDFGNGLPATYQNSVECIRDEWRVPGRGVGGRTRRAT